MEHGPAAIHRMITVLLESMLQFVPANPLRRVLPRALPCRVVFRSASPGHIRITIELELRIPFQNYDPEPENEVAELDEGLPPLELAEAEVDMPAVQVVGVVQGIPTAHVPLLGSLYGVLGHHNP